MTKRIKHMTELPAWFQLKKYDNAKKLDAAGWYEQLNARKECFMLISHYYENNEKSENREQCDRVFQLIRENPIINTSNHQLLATYFGNKNLNELKPKKLNYALGVHPLTMRELFMMQSSVFPDKWQHMQKWWQETNNLLLQFNNAEISPRAPEYPYQSWFDEPVYQSSHFTLETYGTLQVNLELPDNILVEQFKRYLATARRKETSIQHIKKNYRQPDFNDWIRLGILPYLDLKIWEQETHNNIPNRIMANAIYATGEGGEETVRKTTASIAETLVKEESLSSLAAQAALEIAEQNSS